MTSSFKKGFMDKLAEFSKYAQEGQASIDNKDSMDSFTGPGGEYEFMPKVYPKLKSLTPRDLALMSLIMPYFKDNYLGWVGRVAAGDLPYPASLYRDTGDHSVDKVAAKPYSAADLGYFDALYDPALFDRSALQFTPLGTQEVARAWSAIKSTPEIKPEALKSKFNRLNRNVAASVANSALERMPDAPPPEFFSGYVDRVTGRTVGADSAKRGVTFSDLPKYPEKPKNIALVR